MGIGSSFRKFGRKFEDVSRRSAKYTFAIGGGMVAGPTGAKLGYEFGSALDDRKPQSQQSGTDLARLRREAQINGFNPLTVLRATGGQGFYHQQIPMGRLSSDAFFNAFDAYEQRNLPTQINQKAITGQEILAPVTMSNGKLNSDQNTAIYDFEQDPVRLEYVTDGENVFSAKQKSLDNVWVDPWGKKWRLPFEDVEIDTVIMGSYLKALAAGYHAGDVTGKALREKLGQKFGWYGYPKPSAIKKSILPSFNKYDEARKYGILSWITNTEMHFNNVR